MGLELDDSEQADHESKDEVESTMEQLANTIVTFIGLICCAVQNYWTLGTGNGGAVHQVLGGIHSAKSQVTMS
ncbi:hypothetical protein Vi05172_g8983 [Venturia inaequalis]|nr:hypothetical protein Vi05172_g8983 [Venturia inaequalis]